MNGNGGSPHGYCATQDARIEALERRADDQDDVNATVLVTLARIETTQGRAPDPVSGDPGSGQMRILHGLANVLLTGDARSPLQSLIDDDESETTSVMDRTALVSRARGAEHKVRLALIGLGVTIVTTVGAVLIAYFSGG